MRFIGLILGIAAYYYWHWWAGTMVYTLFCDIDNMISVSQAEVFTAGGQNWQHGYSHSSTPVDSHGVLVAAYRKLDLTSECSDNELRRAYRQHVMRTHPDWFEGCDE